MKYIGKPLQSSVSIQLTKTIIRNRILKRLQLQKEDVRKKLSEIIRRKLFRTSFFKQSKIIMFYISFGGEVDTQKMIKEAQNLGKTVVVPVCAKNRIIKACVLEDNAKLQKGPYGILEPVARKRIPLKNLDAVIVPGLAFDKKGMRLGRGKGYYDRFLNTLPERVMSIGLAFRFQILPSVPSLSHDMGVNRIISA